MKKIGSVIDAMINYYAGDVPRINHFLKVYGFTKAIGEMEGIGDTTQEILEAAALTHDIGIKNSEQKYNSASGYYQQLEGPQEAKELLEKLEFGSGLIDRVCWLIAHHHTYDDIKDIDYQILVEADFLVNAYEEDLSEAAVQKIRTRLFKTPAGISFLDRMYLNRTKRE